jgi:molybdenum cofactor guanylyltransferase
MMESVSAIILAGGQSRRMGQDKALIDFRGRPIIAHVIDTLRELSNDVIVVSNRSSVVDSFGARVVPDYEPPAGPLGGIAAGLSVMRHELAIVVACDMPFLNSPLLRYLIEQAAEADAVVMQIEDNFEPLHAVYRRACLTAINQHLAAGDRRVISFYADVRVRSVPEINWRTLDPDGRSTANLNTPDDLSMLR